MNRELNNRLVRCVLWLYVHKVMPNKLGCWLLTKLNKLGGY